MIVLTSLDINRQDEKLEREVDSSSVLELGGIKQLYHNTRRRSRRAYGGKNVFVLAATPNSSKDIFNGNTRKSANRKGKDHSSLPMLLHLREIGLSSHQQYD